jgi:hypothetical protein
MTEQGTGAEEATRYQQLMELRDGERRRIAAAGVCVKSTALPWEVNPQGILKWYMHPAIDATAHKFLIFYSQQIPAGSRSGRQQCQGDRRCSQGQTE